MKRKTVRMDIIDYVVALRGKVNVDRSKAGVSKR